METEKHVHYEFQDATCVAVRRLVGAALRIRSRERIPLNDSAANGVLGRARREAEIAIADRPFELDRELRRGFHHRSPPSRELCIAFAKAAPVVTARTGGPIPSRVRRGPPGQTAVDAACAADRFAALRQAP
jgi:hypothetical protein